MEISNPEEIKINRKTGQILDLTKQRIIDFSKRKLDKEQRENLRLALIDPQIRVSLSMEGINLRSRQTTEILEVYKVTNEIKHEDHAQEVVNLANAIDFIVKNKDGLFSQELLCKIHSIVEKDILEDAGFLRSQNVRIPGASIAIPNYPKLGELIGDLEIYFELSQQQDPIVLSVWLHHQITQLHPFSDGNGRTARLLQDWVLLKNDYFAVSTGHISRNRYLDLLEEADDEDYDELIHSMAEAQSDVIARAIQAVESPQKRKKSIGEIVKAAKNRRNAHITQEYDRWRHYINRVIESFEQSCKELNSQSGVTSKTEIKNAATACEFVKNEIIESAQWERIRRKGWINFNNAFVIWWYLEGQPFYKTVAYYARHFVRKNYDISDNLQKNISIYMGGFNIPPEVDNPIAGIKLHDKKSLETFAQLPWPDEDIALREILIDKSKIYAYCNLPENTNVSGVQGASFKISKAPHEIWMPEQKEPNEFVQEYINNLFSNKAGLG